MPNATQLVQVATAQLGIPKPLAYGNVRAVGNQVLLQSLTDKTRVAFYLLGDGEWDGIDRGWINRGVVDVTDTTKIHFHPGKDGELGHGLVPDSNGGDQRVDNFWSYMPTYLQRLTYSRMAYIALMVAPDPGAPGPDLEVLFDYRTMKVRSFDASGAQVGYAFSTNPAWCFLDAFIRFELKREGLINEALTSVEKARINFASFAAAATYYDTVLANGRKRFEISVAFPTLTNVQAVYEQILLVSRSYTIEYAGQVYLFPDKARASSFTLKSKHVISGSFKPNEKDIRGAANHFIGHFNDLLPTIIATIGATGSVRATNVVTHTTVENPHPFLVGDTVIVFSEIDASFNTTAMITAIPAANQIQYAQVGANATSGGGKIGINENRFTQRAPIVDHEAHQATIGARGAGLTLMPKRRTLNFDFGNNTGESVSRLLQFWKTRTLGVDQFPYKAPISVSVQALLTAVDDNSSALIAQFNGDVITIDPTVSEEFTGDYEIIKSSITPHGIESGGGGDSGSTQGTIELTLKAYVPAAFTDVPLNQPPIRASMPGRQLPQGQGLVNASYVILNSTGLTAADAGSNATITVPSFDVKVLGSSAAAPHYSSGVVTALPYLTNYYVFVDDPDLRGGSLPFQATTSKTTASTGIGRIYIDAIKTPAAAGAPTGGSGSGGTGPRYPVL